MQERIDNARPKRMGITVIFRLPASMVLLTIFLANAQPASNAKRSATVSHATMRSILGGMRLEFTENPSDDSVAFDFQLNGHKVTLLNHIKDMQLSACFDGIVIVEPPDAPANRPALMKMNRWNQDHFSTGAFRDEHGCESLRANLNFAGGMTTAMIEEYIRKFSTAVTVFARFVAELTAGANRAAATPSTGDQPTVDRTALPIGTMAWSQPRADTRSAPPSPSATGSVPGLLRITRDITLRYDTDKWKPTQSHEAGQFALSHSPAQGHALVIEEHIAVPLDAIQDVALANAQFADPEAKFVIRDKRRINGVTLWFLKIEAEVGTVPMVFLGYYYADQSSTVQVVTYTAKTLLPESEHDLMEFLNGLAVSVF